MRERREVRIQPKTAVTVAIEETDRPLAFGVVANISEGGACICTDALFPEGDAVVVQLSFPGQLQPLAMEGYVVWSRPDEVALGARRYGLSWRQPAGPVLQRLIRDS